MAGICLFCPFTGLFEISYLRIMIHFVESLCIRTGLYSRMVQHLSLCGANPSLHKAGTVVTKIGREFLRFEVVGVFHL